MANHTKIPQIFGQITLPVFSFRIDRGLLSLSRLDWRLGRVSGDDKVESQIDALGLCIDSAEKDWRLVEKEIVIKPVVNGSVQIHHGVFVRPLGRVFPLLFNAVPVMGSCRDAVDPFRKVLPDAEHEIDFVRRQNGVVINRQNGISLELIRMEKPLLQGGAEVGSFENFDWKLFDNFGEIGFTRF